MVDAWVRFRRVLSVPALMAGLTCVAACGGSEPEAPGADSETPSDPVAIGTHREVPLEDPCQWLTVAEATEAMDRAGIPVGDSDVNTATNLTGDGVEMADCWYVVSDTAAGHLTVSLMSSRKAATNWRIRMEALADQGGHEVTENDETLTLTRVADAPVLQSELPPDVGPGCDVHALLGDTAVVGVDLGSYEISGRDALCAEAKGVLGTVIERLPEPEGAP